MRKFLNKIPHVMKNKIRGNPGIFFIDIWKLKILEYKVIVDSSCFSVPARVRPRQGNTSNNPRKFYFEISKIHIFNIFKIIVKFLQHP